MPGSASETALIVFNRFGLGPRPGDLTRVGSDPLGRLKAELQADKALIDPETPGLFSSTVNIQTAFAAQDTRKLVRDTGAAPQKPGAQAQGATLSEGIKAQRMADGVKPNPAGPTPETKLYRAEAEARLRAGCAAEIGFVERLVAFWSNHFCVSAGKSDLVRATAGSFEREAIRPYVLGRFADMLMAVERHPTMLVYLDNAQSAGPDSRAGHNRTRGLNENQAREVLELHTLGADAGYTQADVTSLARIITGWTFAGREGRLGEPGSFVFNAGMHQPGDQMVIGRAYLSGGFGQGEAALNDIARHPATARHLATKLVRHFVSDDPPPAAVERLAAVFRNHDGDLRAVAMALIDLPDVWSAPASKVRSPWDLLVAASRLFGLTPDDPTRLLNRLRTLGMPLWEPPGPNGYPDSAAAWASPEGMKLRLDLSAEVARQVRFIGEPGDLLTEAAGQTASEETRAAISRAESREQAVALLFMSPEFQRR